MHPEIARDLVAQRQAELQRRAELGRQRRLAHQARPAYRSPSTRRGWWPARWRWVQRPSPEAKPGVFPEGPDAFGFRTYLTAAEARQLAREWPDSLDRFADRVEEPMRCPVDAVLFEVVVLGRQVPDQAEAARGLPGPAQAD